MMTPHGLTAAGRLSDCKVPQKSELEEYRQHGLLISEDGGSEQDCDIEFLVLWSMNDIDSWLRRLLPKPFEWLDARLGKPAEGSFHWVLLNSERKRYFVLMRPTITGKELDEMKGSVGRKFTAFSVVIAPHINIPQSVYTDWDHAISQVSNGTSVPMDLDGASDMDAECESKIVDSDNAPAWPPSKGKAWEHLQSVLELTTDSGSDSDAVQIIGTAINYARSKSKSTTNQPSITSTTSHFVAPSQSNMPRAMAHLFTPAGSATIPDSESDDDFFFMKLIAC
ncbi:hypothetical protein OG21DRAFT_1518381, partial [Imleria badia]